MNKQLLLTAAVTLGIGLAGGYWLAQQSKHESAIQPAEAESLYFTEVP
ncbi:hypothetical protein [Methylomonas koyamae]|nr:hypothetical protein [Methylomonas koyamae]